jgi:Uma2 family endonuclease
MAMAEGFRPLRRVEYDRLVELGAFADERIELLEGALVEMSPIGPPHSSAVQKLTELLVPALLGRASVRIQQPFAALDTSEPEPDVAVVARGDYDEEHPGRAHLIIEVAESSLERDRDLKRRIYAAAGVSEYWIVNLPGRCIEVHRDAAGGDYRTVTTVAHGESLSPLVFADVRIAVSAVIR